MTSKRYDTQNTFRRMAVGVVIAAATALMPYQSHAAGPTTIKWVKTCGAVDYNHSIWVMGLSDGNKLYGYFNPNQGRAATYSLIMTAYIGGKNIYYENPAVDTGTKCGVVTTHSLEVNYTTTANIMISD